MKKKIFKLLDTYDGPDYLIGRELFLNKYKRYIKKWGNVDEEDGSHRKTINLDLDYIETLLKDKFDRRNGWTGIYWYWEEIY